MLINARQLGVDHSWHSRGRNLGQHPPQIWGSNANYGLTAAPLPRPLAAVAEQTSPGGVSFSQLKVGTVNPRVATF